MKNGGLKPAATQEGDKKLSSSVREGLGRAGLKPGLYKTQARDGGIPTRSGSVIGINAARRYTRRRKADSSLRKCDRSAKSALRSE
jgi:hypothetical protein